MASEGLLNLNWIIAQVNRALLITQCFNNFNVYYQINWLQVKWGAKVCNQVGGTCYANRSDKDNKLIFCNYIDNLELLKQTAYIWDVD